MAADLHLKYINDNYIKLEAEPSIVMELADALTFYAENYKFNPKYKAKVWDGKISLVNRYTGYVYAGLAQKIKKLCDARGYTVSFDPEMIYDEVSEFELKEFLDRITPENLEARDYQQQSILKCLRSKRRTLVSPTSSGKSYMIYALMMWYQLKTLIIVPTTGLVTQMASDFRDYGYQGRIHTSINGLSKDKDIPADVVITTWQSLNNGKTQVPKGWYNQFGVVIGDEVHRFKAKSLMEIMSNLTNCKYRFGTTGTLDGKSLNEHTIEGLFGPVYVATTTKKLMEDGHVSKLKIKCIVLKYNQADCDAAKKFKSYREEIEFIIKHQGRNKFIKNLVLSLKGNRLLFFKEIEHGNDLLKLIKDSGKENVFKIDGSVSAEEREAIRRAIEELIDAILLASLGTTSTGVSVKKLHHMIAGAPNKSKVTVLQSIGRMLRKHQTKEYAVLYDIVDDLSTGKDKNYALLHFFERLKHYEADEFEYEIYNVRLK